MLLAACYTLMDNRKMDYKNIAIVAVFAAYLVFTPIFMYQHREEVGSPQFQELYGAYTTNLETYKKPKAVQYPFVFLLRRTSLVLIIVFLRRNIVAQVLCAVHCSLLMLTWLIQVKPFDTGYKNKLECFNEFIVLVMSYIDFLFTDYVDNPVSRYTFGYFYIGIIAFGLLVNVITMGAATIADCAKACKRRKYKSNEKIGVVVKPVHKVSFAPADLAQMPPRNSFIKNNVIQMSESSESESENSEQADDNSSEQEHSAQKSVNALQFEVKDQPQLQEPVLLVGQQELHRKKQPLTKKYFENYDHQQPDVKAESIEAIEWSHRKKQPLTKKYFENYGHHNCEPEFKVETNETIEATQMEARQPVHFGIKTIVKPKKPTFDDVMRDFHLQDQPSEEKFYYIRREPEAHEVSVLPRPSDFNQNDFDVLKNFLDGGDDEGLKKDDEYMRKVMQCQKKLEMQWEEIDQSLGETQKTIKQRRQLAKHHVRSAASEIMSEVRNLEEKERKLQEELDQLE